MNSSDELKRIFTPLGKTVLIVTHDMREAPSLGTKSF